MIEANPNDNILDIDDVDNIVGIVPAAGFGLRLGNRGFSKELLPIFMKESPSCIDYLITSLQDAGASQMLIALNKNKTDIISHISNMGYKNCLYNIFDSPSLPHSLFSFSHVIGNYKKKGIVLFGLPDTVWEPKNAFSQIIKTMKENEQDFCFGLFDSVPSYLFDSVDINKGAISSILVKKNPPLSKWFWGLGGMTFDAYLSIANTIHLKNKSENELLLGELLNNLIIKNKLKVGGVKLKRNTYFDLGTPDRYKFFLKKSENY